MSYQEVFPDILEKTYASYRNITIDKIPAVESLSSILGNKTISLPFLDTINLENVLRGELDKIAEKDKEVEIKLSESNPKLKRLRKVFLDAGFHENIVKGHIISELTTEKEFWKRFHKHTRNDIRKAQKSDIRIEKISSIDELNNFYKLYFKQMKKFGTPPHSFNFFRNCFEMMGKDFFGLNCYKNGKIIGSILLFLDNNYAYVSFNVSSDKYRKFRPNDLLYWESLKWCMKNNVKYFDMGQIDLNPEKKTRAETLLKFKKKWLGKEYKKLYFIKGFKYSQNKNCRLKKFRKIWSKLPNFIIRIIGPKVCSQLN